MAHNVFDQMSRVIDTGGTVIQDPGASGTFNLADCPTGGIATLTATGTYTLPSMTYAGHDLTVTTDDTSVITLVDGQGSTVCVFTGTSGTTAAYCKQLDSNSWGATVVGQSSGIGALASQVAIADAGSYTAKTNVETSLQELFAKNITSANTAITTVGDGTLTAAGIVGGVITRSGSTAAYSDTTATGALIEAALGAGAVGDAVTDQSWYLFIRRTVAFTQTILEGTDVTLSGVAVIPGNSTGVFLMRYIGSTDAVQMIGLGSIPQCHVKNAQFTTIATDTTITAAAGTLTGAKEVFYCTTAAGAGGIALTTRTATQMFADIPNCHIGYSWKLRIISDGGGTVTLTAPGGGGVTLTGTATSALNTWRDWCCTFTSATAVTFQNVGIGTIDVT